MNMNNIDLLSNLSPEIWSECVSYLAPKEISQNTQLICKNLSSREGAERAAWIAVLSIAKIAHRYTYSAAWETKTTTTTTADTENNNETTTTTVNEKDAEAEEVQRLLLNDRTIVGELMRNIPDAVGLKEKGRSDGNIYRFQNETWQDLYGMIHTILTEDIVGTTTTITNERQIIPEEEEDSGSDDDDEQGVEEEEDEEDEVVQQGGVVDVVFDVDVDVDDDDDDDDVVSSSTGEIIQTEDQTDKTRRLYDHENIALVMGLIFNSPPLPKQRLTDQKRQKLASIARAYSRCLASSSSSSSSNDNNTRYSLISLRLGNLGLWDIASDILQSHHSFSNNSDPSLRTIDNAADADADVDAVAAADVNDAGILSIDCMIYSSTFLIDRLYSQTFIRNNNEDDTTDLVNAVRIGRDAVVLAEKHYNSTEDKGSCYNYNDNNSNVLNGDDDAQVGYLQQPPPPIQSLFADNALRYIHARLALVRATTLLAQHIGLDAADISTLGITPTSFTEEYLQALSGYSLLTQRYHYTQGFFNESHQQYISIHKWYSQLDSRLAYASDVYSITAELLYCFATTQYTFSLQGVMPPGSHIDSTVRSIEIFSSAFRYFIVQIFNKIIYFDGKAIKILIQCAKDLGKTCNFAQRTNTNNSDVIITSDKEGRHINPGMFFDFAYILSIYQYGSYHPTSKNIKEIDDRREQSDIGSISDRYYRIVPWLVNEYFNNEEDE